MARFPVACGEPQTIGPREGRIWRYVSFDVSKSARYIVDVFDFVENGGEQEIQVARCDGDCNDESGLAESRPVLSQEVFCWTPGRYVFRLETPEQTHADFLISIETRGESDCAP
jgi:hypothetical protein